MKLRSNAPILQILARSGPLAGAPRTTVRASKQLPSFVDTRPQHAFFSSTPQARALANRVYDPIRTPPTFHDYLRSASASNTLLLLLFSTSACPSCKHITPLLTDLVTHRVPAPADKFNALAFAEVELDSPDTSNGNMMMEVGVEFGVTSMPTLMGFGGRRAQRLTDRIVDTTKMRDQKWVEAWVDEVMSKGDPHGGATGGEGSSGGGLLSRLFG